MLWGVIMITMKKKNKILIILIGLVISFIAIIFPFVIKNNNKNIGVLAESSTAPDITLDWFTNFSNYNNIDIHTFSFNFNSSNSSIILYCNLLDGVSFNNSSLSTNFYFKSSILIEFSESVSFSFLNNSLLNILQIEFIAPNSTIFSNLLTLPFLIVFEYNGDFFIISSLSYEYAYDSYKEALSSDYNDGYDAGLSAGESIGYENGYNDAITNFEQNFNSFSYFLDANVSYYSFNSTSNTYELLTNIDNDYLTINSTSFNELNVGFGFGGTTQLKPGVKYKVYNYLLQSNFFTVSSQGKITIDLINNMPLNLYSFFNTSSSFSVVGFPNLFDGTIICYLNTGQQVSFSNFNLSDGLNLKDYFNANLVKIDILFNDFSILNGFKIFASNVNSGIYYEQGFNDGKNSVNTSSYYNNGFNDGYESGKNYGIANANKYSFLGLIGAIIDAPIKAFTGLFNFEILGFNMANFFLGLFTLCVIIVIVKFVMGAK